MRLPYRAGFLSLALLLPMGAAIAGCGRTQASAASSSTSDASLPIAPVVYPKTEALSNELVVAGELIPYQQVQLHAKVSGYIQHIYVDIGDRVHKGEDLADLEIPELLAQVQAAKAGVQRAEQTVLASRSAVLRAKANYAALHDDYIRLKQAAKVPGLIAEQELDDAQAKDSASAAQVAAAEASLSGSEQALDVAKADSAHYAALASYSHITAPFSGVVSARYSDTGALVQAGTSSASAQPVVQLDQTDVLRLRLPVPSNLAPFVKIGDPAKILMEGTGQRLTGKVVRTTGALDLATRTLQVEIDLKNPNNKLLPGMYADVTLDIRRSGKELTIPVEAVDQTVHPPYAYVVNAQGRIEKRELELGIQSPSRVEVLSGLQPGDEVVATNLASYQPGEQVKAQQAVLPQAPGSNGNGE